MTHRPVGSGVSVATSVTSAQTSAFTCQSNAIRLVASGAGVFVAIGTNPTATTSDYYIPANTSAVLALDIGSQRVVGITTGTTTTIDFPEGTGSPFDVGETVTLTASSQTYYNFSHATVESVDSSSNVGGYFSTRITVNANTSGIVTAFTDTDTTLRKSLKVAARTDTGTGTLYAQQVQVTGQA